MTPLSLLAAALALVVPSPGIAHRSDLLLAVLVLVSALGISAGELLSLRHHARTLVALSIAPVLLLGAFGWLLGRAFPTAVQHGLMATGLASAEVASVSLVSLAGADSAVALGIVAGSLVTSALLAPPILGLLSPTGHVHSVALLGRFALVVLAPLAAGVTLRTLPGPRQALTGHDEARDGFAGLIVIALVYAALSGSQGARGLGTAILASAGFLTGSVALAAIWMRIAGARAPSGTGAVTGPGTTAAPADAIPGASSIPIPGAFNVAIPRASSIAIPGAFSIAIPGAFSIGMRDFAVAATLATQAYGIGAATVPGIYGVLMLVGASLAAAWLSPRRSPLPRPAPPGTSTQSSC